MENENEEYEYAEMSDGEFLDAVASELLSEVPEVVEDNIADYW